MDAKLREDLLKKYTQFLEGRLEERDVGSNEAGLLSAAAALLGAYQPDHGQQRFRVLRFYEVAENALRTLRSSSLQALEVAFAMLETVCTNLLLFPWKKEFRHIKTFTGPYVYHLQSAVCEADLHSILRSMGYVRDQELQYHARDHPGGAAHLRQLAFELFLARAECGLLREVVALAGGAAKELEAVEVRRSSREDAAGCAEALRRRDVLVGEVSRLSVRLAETERAHLRRSGRPSKSVDVTDSAGHWHPASKPVLKASLSLRKEPLFVDAEEDAKDEIIRPNVSLLSLAALSPYSPAPDFYPVQSPSAEPYSYHLSSLDEVDLYTERGGGRQTPSRPPSREPRDGRESWGPKGHGGLSSLGPKCQGCGLGCSGLASCQRCEAVLCPGCHAMEPSPCCCSQDYPKPPRPLDGYLPVKEKLSVYTNSHSEKPLLAAKLYPGKSAAAPGGAGAGGSRCGFCNKPGATHTCMNCSKVSCDNCMGLYAKDLCGRKSMHHNFVPNHQLNYKSGSMSHLVYR
ncbi:spermatogenesis-associated protein 2 [Anguilla anguilla]|uniref:spermatogenesis-associated protein 2 n=1 Tax=Anguilla anguilla TaxID=7936 RepID=UPI0015AD7D5C|nr:spermatogenesis-associated protein 2 [Anguilla anguilla]XP_035238685.1 spermatogenesis-associated protein 2 [Anguilla anguilla]XP_035238686.1 spermatogenesis-associated protein 2 [Anguilla anguilla]